MNVDIKVSLQLLKGSGHVQYLRNHPEDYLNQINIFTDYCLKIYIYIYITVVLIEGIRVEETKYCNDLRDWFINYEEKTW